ncbi:MAG: hypothetical protein AB2A00_40540, partial [Myxococcota bacterium]
MSKQGSRVPPEVEALYRLPLSEFTPARNGLEKELRKAGRKDEAAMVKALRKPTTAQWAINQVAHENPRTITALLKAADTLRRAQSRALSGGSADALREAQQAFRGAVGDVTRAAEKVLEAGGYAAGGNVDAVRTSLMAVPTASEEDLELLRTGMLAHDVQAGDVEDVLGMLEGALRAAPPRPKAEPPRQADGEDGQARRQHEMAVAEAQRQVAAARAESDRRSDEARKAERDVAEARKEVERLGEALEKAREQLRGAEGRV